MRLFFSPMGMGVLRGTNAQLGAFGEDNPDATAINWSKKGSKRSVLQAVCGAKGILGRFQPFCGFTG
jgi:hypothetical protein